MYGTSDYTISGSTDNLGNYFYKNPMLTYDIVTSSGDSILNSQTIGTTQVTSGITGDHFDPTVSFSINETTSAPTKLANQLVLSVTPHNINGTGTLVTSSNNIIVDTQSDLADRVENASIGTALGDVSVLDPYDEAHSIISTTDLQCVNGNVCTKTSNSYLDYTPYWYFTSGASQKNSLNYSVLPSSGTRYVTVRQQFPVTIGPAQNINVTIHHSGITYNVDTKYFNAIKTLYYRFIDITNNVPSSSNTQCISSYWIAGIYDNTSQQPDSFTAVTGTNYADPTLDLFGDYGVNTSTSTQITGHLSFPNTNVEEEGYINHYVYVQIGLDMSVPDIQISSIEIIIS
jgi:hypothetical protein